jgi:hypothetical protein
VKTAGLLVTNEPLRRDKKFYYQFDLSRIVVSHPSLEKSEGWGTQFIGRSMVDHPPNGEFLSDPNQRY